MHAQLRPYYLRSAGDGVGGGRMEAGHLEIWGAGGAERRGLDLSVD